MKPEIILTARRAKVSHALLSEHDGIMEQITFEHSGDNGYPRSLTLAEMPWKYVLSCCRIQPQTGRNDDQAADPRSARRLKRIDQ